MQRHPNLSILMLLLGVAAGLVPLGAAFAQMPAPVPNDDPNAIFPPIPPIAFYDEVKVFRAEVERDISRIGPSPNAHAVCSLVDTLVSAFDRYGNRMDREHGDFPNFSRGRPYWLITTDEAADTLTDRLSRVVEAYIRANPTESLGEARAQWEAVADGLGVPRNRLFGFQFVELAKRASGLRQQLEAQRPADVNVLRDANVRFLWDLVQFYQQLHGTWYDRQMMRVADEDWIVHRMVGRCKDPKWQLAFSMTAIGVDTSNADPMSDKFMHRLKLIDPACPETIDFVITLPHYRLMERELEKLTPAQKDSLLRRARNEAISRGSQEQMQGSRPAQGSAPDAASPRNAVPQGKR